MQRLRIAAQKLLDWPKNVSDDENDQYKWDFEDGDDLGEAAIADSNQFGWKVVGPNAGSILFDGKKSGMKKIWILSMFEI